MVQILGMVLNVLNVLMMKGNKVTIKLKKDGWYYTNINYRFHGKFYEGTNIFRIIWDLEKIKK